MALKDLFTMLKANRYTADGREELIKAQEAETEDKVYQIGEISQKTGLQKTANGWRPVKKGAGAKNQAAKELANMNHFEEQKKAAVKAKHEEALKQERREGEARGKAWADAAEVWKKKNPNYKEMSGDDIIKGISAELAAREKESKPSADWKETPSGRTNMIRTPEGTATVTWNKEANGEEWYGFSTVKNNKMENSDTHYKTKAEAQLAAEKELKGENEPAANVKRNESEAVKNGDKTIYRIKGTQFYFNTPEEAENAILAKNRGGATYARPSQDTTVNNIQESLGFKLDTPYGGKHSMDDFMKKTGENEYAVNVWSFGTDSKRTLINPLSESDKPNATIKKENGEWKLHYKDRDGKETVVTANGRQDPTRDAAPRVLTGDTRIRIRKA